MTDYTPIHCSDYDQLEALATTRRHVEVVWNEGGEERTERSRITNLYAKDGEEYLELESGTTVRLDRLADVLARPEGEGKGEVHGNP